MTAQLQKVFDNLDQKKIAEYKTYWDNLSPKTDSDYYNRWIFSFLSVHTTWAANINSYLLLNENAQAWLHNKQELDGLLRRGGCGLYHRRKEGIWLFKYLFWENPNSWKKQDDETWSVCRKRLEKRCYGLGYAKTAFALELCYPTTCESVCLDTHMLQLYGYDAKTQHKVTKGRPYIQLENDWIERCKKHEVPSYIARCLFWDEKQRHTDSRYWSYVFEPNAYT